MHCIIYAAHQRLITPKMHPAKDALEHWCIFGGAIPPRRSTQSLCNSLNWLAFPLRIAIQMQFKLIVPGIPGSCANCAVVSGGLRAAILLQSPSAMTGRLRRDCNLQSEGNPRLYGNCEVPWNCNRIYWLLMDCKSTTGFSECCLNRSMHDAIHPQSGGFVPELRGFV